MCVTGAVAVCICVYVLSLLCVNLLHCYSGMYCFLFAVLILILCFVFMTLLRAMQYY